VFGINRGSPAGASTFTGRIQVSKRYCKADVKGKDVDERVHRHKRLGPHEAPFESTVAWSREIVIPVPFLLRNTFGRTLIVRTRRLFLLDGCNVHDVDGR